jgi:hypothetical protein
MYIGGQNTVFLLAAGIFAAIIVVIVRIARWLGAPRWLAFIIPNILLLVLLVYSLGLSERNAAQGGAAMAAWPIVAIMLVITLPVSAIASFAGPKK